MSTTFTEIVIEGRFLMVKGFMLGFLGCHKPDGKYFFHQKENIRRETFGEFLKEFFELDNYVHFCLEDDLLEPFKKALTLYTQRTGYTIKSERPVKGAEFSFAVEVYNKDLADQFKKIIEHLPEGVSLENYVPSEEINDDAKGFEAYAPLHAYIFRAKGLLKGDFEGIMKLYLDLKRSDLNNFIILSQVKLHF